MSTFRIIFLFLTTSLVTAQLLSAQDSHLESTDTLLIQPRDSVDIEKTEMLSEEEIKLSINQTADSISIPLLDSTQFESADTLHIPIIRRIEIYTDYLKLIGSAFPSEKKAEVGIGIVTGLNVGISLEMGYGEKTPEDYIYNGSYGVSGYYGRIGLSYYYAFLPEVNFYGGLKYGISQYQDEATVKITSSLWNNYEEYYLRENLEANWAEIVLGSESRWKSNFYLGFIFRIRIMIDQKNFDPIEVYTIPGYGRSFAKSVPALNLYIKYLINFK